MAWNMVPTHLQSIGSWRSPIDQRWMICHQDIVLLGIQPTSFQTTWCIWNMYDVVEDFWRFNQQVFKLLVVSRICMGISPTNIGLKHEYGGHDQSEIPRTWQAAMQLCVSDDYPLLKKNITNWKFTMLLLIVNQLFLWAPEDNGECLLDHLISPNHLLRWGLGMPPILTPGNKVEQMGFTLW